MGLKILHSADWHMDTPFCSVSSDQQAFLRREQQKLPGKIADLCRREKCDLVLLAGDLFDGDASWESLGLVKEALKACGVPVFISPGNHDFCAPGSPWLEESWPENVHIFTGGLESVALPELDCRVYGAGYQSMDCPALLEGFQAEGQERYCVAVLHSDPLALRSPYCPISGRQIRDSGLDYLALGHIHKAGGFQAGATLCAWPGCPMGRGWDETGEKGVFLVNLEETAEIQTVTLDGVCFFDLEVDITEDAAQALEQVLPPAGSRDFYRITLTGCGTVDTAQLLRQFSAFPNLELRDRTEAPVDLWAGAEEDTLRGVYFRKLREKAEDNPRARQAAEISRKLLAGREVKLP